DREGAVGAGLVGLARELLMEPGQLALQVEEEPSRRGTKSLPPAGGLGRTQQVLERDHAVPEASLPLHAAVPSGPPRSQPPISRPISSMALLANPLLSTFRHCRSLASRIWKRSVSSVRFACSSSRCRFLVYLAWINVSSRLYRFRSIRSPSTNRWL